MRYEAVELPQVEYGSEGPFEPIELDKAFGVSLETLKAVTPKAKPEEDKV